MEQGEWLERVQLDLLDEDLGNFGNLAELLAACESRGISLCGAVGSTTQERRQSFVRNVTINARDNPEDEGPNEWLNAPWRRALMKSTMKVVELLGQATTDATAEAALDLLVNMITDKLSNEWAVGQ